jgi:hypothetical protein
MGTEGGIMAEEFIVVETTSGIIEAEILRGLLESSGITVRLSHEAVSTVFGLGVGPVAEVELIVPADQEREARLILADYHSGKLIEEDEDTEE